MLISRSLCDVRSEPFQEGPQLTLNDLSVAALISSAQVEEESTSRLLVSATGYHEVS